MAMWRGASGLMFPDLRAFYICGVEDINFKEKLDYLEYVYGYKISAIKRSILRESVIMTNDNCDAGVTTS